MKSNLRLGRGLDALIKKDSGTSYESPTPSATHQLPLNSISRIPISRISANKFQPRKDFGREALEELKTSIKENGLVQPITVRRVENGMFELVSGERRYRAVSELGEKDIPAYVLQVESDSKMLELALTENLQREDLNAIEIATGYQRLIDECNLTQEQVAERVGKDRATVTNFVRLLKLPAQIQKSLIDGDISAGHARALLAIDDPAERFRLFNKIARHNLSVRQVEKEVRQILGKEGKKQGQGRHAVDRGTGSSTITDPIILDVIDKLRRHLGTQVKISYNDSSSGEIRIEFYNVDDLGRVVELILQDQEG
jgi:ParB family transcriptional regulator, chromosome partitioning protein